MHSGEEASVPDSVINLVAVVSFHPIKGHVIDSVHPRSGVHLSEDELKAIAHFSLPDTTIETEGDICYNFRFQKDSSKFSYGSVFFRQVKDVSFARGYLQKSVVAITSSPEFTHVTNEFLRIIAPIYFAYGNDVLEVACAESASWPSPGSAGATLTVAGTKIEAQPYPSTDLFQDIPLFATFGSLSIGLWLLWELVLTGQQILVLGPTPDRCSRAVLGICSLISPIPLAVDYRPFFTMFDKDFAAISRGENVVPVIVGADETQVARTSQTLRSLLRNRRWERSLLLTKEAPLVSKDEALLASLRRLGTDPKATITGNNEKLRRTFRNLTKQFLEPLESFVRLKPIGERAAQGGLRVRAYQDDVLFELNSFSKAEFLSSLRLRPPKEARQFPLDLYRGFMNGPNFQPWLDNEMNKLTGEHSRIRRTLIVETDVASLLSTSKPPARTLASKVLHALNCELAKPNRDEELCNRMAEHLRALTNTPLTKLQEPTM